MTLCSSSVSGTATISPARFSPRRMPASKPSRTMSMARLSAVMSRRISGWRAQKSYRRGSRMAVAAQRGTLRRMLPAGLARCAFTLSRASLNAPRAGAIWAKSACPASVRATLRVVRCSRRTPRRSSRACMACEMVDGLRSRRAAARRKLPVSAMATKVASSA